MRTSTPEGVRPDPPRRKPSRLETVIRRRETRADASARRSARAESRAEARRLAGETRAFRRDFGLLFAKFRRLAKCAFDRWNHRHATFAYKGGKYSIAFEKWLHEGSGVDGYDTSGTMWALHRWCGGWEGDPHNIVDGSEVKPGKDYSNEVVRLLA